MGLPEVLTVVFVILKLLGVIDWPWVIVFLPTIIEAGIALLIGLLVFFGVVSKATRTRR